MLPLCMMGNTEDPFLKSMIPGGLMYPDSLSSLRAVTAPLFFWGYYVWGWYFWAQILILQTHLENSLNVSKIQQAPKNADQAGECLPGRKEVFDTGSHLLASLMQHVMSTGIRGLELPCMKFLYWEVSQSSYLERRCNLVPLKKNSVYVCSLV